MNNQEIARDLKIARMRANLTQQQLGERVGMTRTAIAKTESGKRVLRAFEFVKLRQHISIDRWSNRSLVE